MAHRFGDDVLTGVLGHMNSDHNDDNLLFVRAFDRDDHVAAEMVSFDGDVGRWVATTADGESVDVVIPWPGGPITERADVRREIVALYDESCRRLGVEPRAH